MSITVPAGFRLSGVRSGIKQDATKEDLTLIVADAAAVAAGVYTQNLVYAAPVAVDRQRTPTAEFRVLVANSGNANACTGQRGLEDAEQMARLAAEACGADSSQALVMSTGIIGHFLPMDKIANGIRQAANALGSDEAAFLAAARGILTTDKGLKIAARELQIGDHTIRLAGMAKGAGMIGPRMATMLAVVLTDAPLAVDDAQTALTTAVGDSFNCISVEGHTSTNDTLLLLASGEAGGRPLAGDDLAAFQAALNGLCIELARMIPDDGEGATHLITIEIQGAASRDDAMRIARAIADSALVKTAIAGGDPNWGRIVSAAGYSGATLDPDRLSLSINGTRLFSHGGPVDFDAPAVSRSIRDNRETHLLLELAEGAADLRFWTSDLTTDYVRFNADYHT
ncbi:MAG: bifunctional glutamate N-acetyltransferase/amino-acid acetyltransferase ArgJ [Pirellulaceae bacterium]|nr:bifunctional glutamate N-acetyltransferase/amino-acid acetyltransferase ArgJ [Pirellulaceae bacterium]